MNKTYLVTETLTIKLEHFIEAPNEEIIYDYESPEALEVLGYGVVGKLKNPDHWCPKYLSKTVTIDEVIAPQECFQSQNVEIF
jgi:hypothetical protein